MFWKTVILGILTTTALLATPAATAAYEEAPLPIAPCVEVETDPPGVVIDPSCLPALTTNLAPLPGLTRVAF